MGRRRRARRGAARPDGRRGERRDARARLGRPRGRGQGAGPSRVALPGARPRRAAAPPPARRGARRTARSSTSRARGGCPSSRRTACATRSGRDKDLFDALTCIRHHTHLDAAGTKLHAGRERHLKSAADMQALFSDLPGVLEESAALASRLSFTLADLGYRFPEYPIPPGETPSSYLRRVTWEGARGRFRPLTTKAQAQLTKELNLIEKLDLAGYFLIVWDIVNFCRARAHPRAGARLGREQRRLLRALDHGGRPRPDGAPLRALPLGGARRVARHRPRPALGRPAGEGHPARLQDVRRARRRDDGERHHVPRPLGRARDGEGRRLRAGPGRHARQAPRAVQLRRVPRRRSATSRPRWPPRASTPARRA